MQLGLNVLLNRILNFQHIEASTFQIGTNLAQPLALLLQIFGEIALATKIDDAPDQDFYYHLGSFFTRHEVGAGTTLWYQGDEVDCLYLVEQGLLRSVVEFREDDEEEDEGMEGLGVGASRMALVRRRPKAVAATTRATSVENILPGTLVGELALFTGKSRSSTLTSDKPSVLWRLDREVFEKMGKEEPLVALKFTRLALNFSAERLGIVTSYASHLA